LYVAVALSGLPAGQKKIQTINEQLLAAAPAPKAFIERDSAFWTMEVQENRKQYAKHLADVSAKLGMQGTPLVANYWVNRGSSRDSQTVNVNDGKIRLVELGGLGCPYCMMGMLAMERLHHRYPEVEFNTVSFSGTTWGNRVLGAKEVADREADHIINFMHVTYPYGMILPTKKVATEDDGEAEVAVSTLFDDKEYAGVGKPTFYIVDGSGKIRFFLGGFGKGREHEDVLARMIEFLQKERNLNTRKSAA
jgi:thiol-disulfide isomerase/thioredoxin